MHRLRGRVMIRTRIGGDDREGIRAHRQRQGSRPVVAGSGRSRAVDGYAGKPTGITRRAGHGDGRVGKTLVIGGTQNCQRWRRRIRRRLDGGCAHDRTDAVQDDRLARDAQDDVEVQRDLQGGRGAGSRDRARTRDVIRVDPPEGFRSGGGAENRCHPIIHSGSRIQCKLNAGGNKLVAGHRYGGRSDAIHHKITNCDVPAGNQTSACRSAQIGIRHAIRTSGQRMPLAAGGRIQSRAGNGDLRGTGRVVQGAVNGSTEMSRETPRSLCGQRLTGDSARHGDVTLG